MNEKKILLSFEGFLRSGELGPIHLGMTDLDLESTIGMPERPEHIESYPGERAAWCYFPVEVRLYQNVVHNIGIGFQWWEGEMPEWMEFDGYHPVKNTTMFEVRKFLESKNIVYEHGRDGRMLRTIAGVWIFPTPEWVDTIMTVAIEADGPWAHYDRERRNGSNL